MKLSSLTLALAALALTVPASASALPIDPTDQADARCRARQVGRHRDPQLQLQGLAHLLLSHRVHAAAEHRRSENGKPVKRRSTRNYRDVDTVEKLFHEAQAALDDDNFSITYAPRKGFPRRINSDPSFMIADEEVSYRVRHFAVPID